MTGGRVRTTLVRTVRAAIALLVAVLVLVGITGFWVFSRATVDAVEPADAVVVLGGEHDGREEYALSLARQGFASTVLLSDPYPAADSVMTRLCDTRQGGIEVLCRRPVPSTTRGEAILAKQLAVERNWTRIIVVSWRFHLPRARLIFGQCYSSEPGAVLFRAVPRSYEYSVLRWEFTYAYQYFGFIKAITQGSCT